MSSTITPEQRAWNLKLHAENDVWGGSPYYLIEVSDTNDIDLIKFIRSTNPRSILDFGCGKGYAADNLKQLFPAIDIVKYDPCFPEFETYPEGKFDLVLCYQVVQMTDATTLALMVQELEQLTEKYLIVGAIIRPNEDKDEKLDYYLSFFKNFAVVFKKLWRLAPERLSHKRDLLQHWINNYHVTLILKNIQNT